MYGLSKTKSALKTSGVRKRASELNKQQRRDKARGPLQCITFPNRRKQWKGVIKFGTVL